MGALGGAGVDWIMAEYGDDLIIGGADGDIFYGGTGKDRLYADTRMAAEEAIYNGNRDANLAAKGDWLSGAAGDDPITHTGGAWRNLLYGVAGGIRMRWRICPENINKRTAANDETTRAWRAAA